MAYMTTETARELRRRATSRTHMGGAKALNSLSPEEPEAAKTEFDMTALLEEMIQMMKTGVAKNTAITFACPDNILIVTGDAGQIREVIMNLMVNASEAVCQAHGEITVSLARMEITAGEIHEDCLGMIIPEGGYVCTEVVDNGCGMDDETMQRIFEPFYSTKFLGRGLGMSAVHGIVAANDGALQLYSRPGFGTTVRLYLPTPIDKPAEEGPDKRLDSGMRCRATREEEI